MISSETLILCPNLPCKLEANKLKLEINQHVNILTCQTGRQTDILFVAEVIHENTRKESITVTLSFYINSVTL